MMSFIKIWLIYFAVGATAWCLLAGFGGLLLTMVFLSDSGEYAKGMAQATLVLIVYPLAAWAVAAGALGGIHLLLKRKFSGKGKSGESKEQEATSIESGNHCDPALHKKRTFPTIRVFVCLFVMVTGLFVIASNGPRSLQESGIVPTVITSFVFFFPLVLIPGLMIVKLINHNSKIVEQHAKSDASGAD